MAKDKRSDVIKLLDLVWKNANVATGHSWERLNHAMDCALNLAIGSGFEFEIGDFVYIAANYRFGYWSGDAERYYCASVMASNSSAYKSFELWKKREPFIADDVTPHHRSQFVRGGGGRVKDRLAIGSQFTWKGCAVTVTSFAKDSKSLTACSYKPHPDGGYGRDIDRRFKITRDDIIADRAERKERAELIAQLTRIAEATGKTSEIKEALGVTTNADLALLAIPKLAKVLQQFSEAA